MVQTPANTSTNEENTVPDSIFHPHTSSANAAIESDFQAAQDYYDAGLYQQSLQMLEDKVLIAPSSLEFDANLLAALASAKIQNHIASVTYINQAESLNQARHPDQQNTLDLTKAQILEAFGSWPEAVKARLNLSFNLPLDEGQANEELLWQDIQNLSEMEMAKLYEEQLPSLEGWLALSDILRNSAWSLEQQLQAYQDWQLENPSHPAAQNTPQDFQVMASIEQMEAQRIVLMLPTTGRLRHASQAIIDGFFAAYYHKQNQRPDVYIVNTAQYDNIEDALVAAYQQEPDVIVGPLQKSAVARLSQLALEYPVIALNQLEINTPNPNLYHFSLSPEDDIQQLILFAKKHGANKAAILSTEDTWALKQADEFLHAADKEKITITSNQTYENSPLGRQNAIQKLLLVDESLKRKSLIQGWTGEQVESTVRSRQDLDYVFYVGRLDDAKQIRPLIDFYFADKIPMLASSSLHDNQPGKNIKFADIERILFTEIPALTANTTSNSNLPPKAGSNILRRLQALGADSYLLANRYPLFQQLPNTRIVGNTGTITLDDEGVFHKRPQVMTYQKGNLVNAKSERFFQTPEDS
ncbi:hypothetical protein GCM10027340_02590 [Marinomonas epiphytica]